MILVLLAALLAFAPVPPLIPTLGNGTPAPAPYHSDVASTATMTELPATGWATFYNNGVFETVLRNRGLPADACVSQGRVGCVAMLWEKDQGREICAVVNGEVYGPYIVVDMASDRDRPGLIADGWVLDVQYEVWFEQWNLPRAPTVIAVIECEDV